MKKILTLPELAAKLGLTEMTVRQLRCRSPQSLPIPFALRPLAWKSEVVDRWIKEHQRAGNP